MPPIRIFLAVTWMTVALTGVSLPADSIIAKGLTFKGRVVRIDGDRVVFRSETGVESARPLAEVGQITIDDEPAFNAAEAAMAAGKPDAAIDVYRKTIAATTKDWLRARSAVRLIEAGAAAKRFDATVAGYVALAQSDPKGAAALKPKIVGKGTALDPVIRDVKKATDDTRISGESRQQLMAFLAELQQARGDAPAATRTVQQARKSDPAAPSAVPGAWLDNAKAALAKRDFAKAKAEVESAAPLLEKATEQAEGLYLLAEAQAGLADTRADPAALKDAALAYMRVVAHFKSAPGAPRVAESLHKTAGLLERLDERDRARDLYAQLAAQYPRSPVAADARAAAQRLAQQGK